MSSFSKHFPDVMRAISCRELFHPDCSCWHAAIANNFTKPLSTCARFFAPIFLLLRRVLAGHYNHDTLSELFDAFVRTTLTGYLGSACGQTCCCIMYNMLGKMYLFTTVLLPVSFGNLWGFAMPAQVNGMFSDYLVMMVVEAYYRSDDMLFLRLVNKSKHFRTLLFMTMSAFILNTNRLMKTDIMWFVQPFLKKPAQTSATTFVPAIKSPLFDQWLPVEHHVCNHAGSCDEYVMQGVQNNLQIGVIIEMTRFLIDNVARLGRSPMLIFSVFSQMKVRVIGFFIGYTTIYRIINCSLNRYYGRDTQNTNTIAAFAAGSVFVFYPDLTILSHATVSTVKSMWIRYVHGSSSTHDKPPLADGSTALSWLRRVPMSRLMYVFAIGYVFHLRLFYPWICSDLLFKTTFYTSGFISDQVTLNTSKYIFGAVR